MIELLGWLIVAVAMARMVWLAVHPHNLGIRSLVSGTVPVPVPITDEPPSRMTG
ncbi:MAG: hypothetical protein ACR2LE_01090 [Nocardioidaceae bacterium]